MMKTHLMVFLLMFLYGSCKDEGTPPLPPHVSTVRLTMEEVGVTDVWLRLEFTDLASPRDFVLRRGSTTVLSGLLIGQDTLLLDTSAGPGTSYNYVALRLNGTTGIDSSIRLEVTTLDTTSHAGYAWEVDTLGDGNSSVLFDVAIINDTLMYAVGKMYLRDSLGNWDPNAYNAAKWNGVRWELKRIPFIGPCSAVNYPPIMAVWALSSNTILVTNGGSIVTYDETNAVMDCRMNSLLTGAINKIYAVDAQHIFLVGNAGNIVQYSNGVWQRVESGTGVSLRDINGNADGSKVWAAGYQSDLSRSVVLEYAGQTWRTVRDLPYTQLDYADSLSGIITSVYPLSDRYIFAASDAGTYLFQAGSHGEAKRSWLPPPFSVGLFNRVRGNALNNVFVVGVAGTIAHYNGASWFQYQQFFDFSGQPNLRGLSVRENTVIALGNANDRAIIIRGRK